MFTIKSALILVGALVLAASTVTAGDLGDAEKAYPKGDYPTVFKDFHELADIGQPTAEFNLAVLYGKGQGTRQSEIYAYTWAHLAAQNCTTRAQAIVDELAPRLALAPGSDSQDARRVGFRVRPMPRSR